KKPDDGKKPDVKPQPEPSPKPDNKGPQVKPDGDTKKPDVKPDGNHTKPVPSKPMAEEKVKPAGKVISEEKSNKEKNGAKELPKTGEETSNTTLFSGILALVGGALLLRRKRKSE
ncbi:LPXTG cell wall anchor domain-containing protein, partial [Staphylococcus aureus]